MLSMSEATSVWIYKSEDYGTKNNIYIDRMSFESESDQCETKPTSKVGKLSASRAELKTNSAAVGGDEEEEELRPNGFHEGVLADVCQGEALEIRLNRQCCEYAR